jgi:hypothetical protein
MTETPKTSLATCRKEKKRPPKLPCLHKSAPFNPFAKVLPLLEPI